MSSGKNEVGVPLQRNLSSIPCNGLTLSWHNISVWVQKKSEEKSSWVSTRYQDSKIIRKVSGIAEPGTLLAIMGPSGAGKTTLLATISHRLKGDVKGQILVNGKEISKKLMLKISGFVPQQDLTLDSLTVIEHMHLMARLKMDKCTNAANRTQRILTLLSELGIVKCTHTRLSALSGGEKKRVSLAVQMLTDPPLLFCDEPTTGLDSYSATTVVSQLRRVAGRGKVVVCTIHQPASGIFDDFHNVYLMVSGGRLALACPTNETPEIFQSMGLICPPSFNIAEFIVSQLAISENVESKLRVSKIVQHFKTSVHYEQLLKKLEIQLDNSSSTSMYEPEEEFQKYLSIQPPDWSTQLYWLLWRSVIEILRKPQDQIIRLCFYLFLALLISTPYIGLTIDQEGIQNMQGFLYLCIVETTFTFNYSVIHTFPTEIPILLREVGNGLYTPAAYYISKMIILIPRAVFEPIIFSAMTFYIVGLFGGFIGFLEFCLPLIAVSIAATAQGCLMSAMFESVSTSSLVSVPLEQFTLLFCGIFLSLSDIPLHFAWVKYISMFYYGLEAVSVLQWSRISNITCSTTHPNAPCISSGEGVLRNYGYSEDNYFMDLMGLLGIYCVCHIIGYFAFWKRSKQQAAY